MPVDTEKVLKDAIKRIEVLEKAAVLGKSLVGDTEMVKRVVDRLSKTNTELHDQISEMRKSLEAFGEAGSEKTRQLEKEIRKHAEEQTKALTLASTNEQKKHAEALAKESKLREAEAAANAAAVAKMKAEQDQREADAIKQFQKQAKQAELQAKEIAKMAYLEGRLTVIEKRLEVLEQLARK